MSSPTRVQEVVREAICSALYNLPFTRFLGERPRDGAQGDTVWFRLSRDPSVENSARTDPKQVMVAVECQEPGLVVIQVGWLNLSQGLDHPTRGEIVMRIGTVAAHPDDLRPATEEVVVKILSIYNDVLTEKGVAGPIEQIAPESEAGDEDDPDDLALSDEEVGRE